MPQDLSCYKAQKGQSLVELVLVMLALVPILIAVAYAGLAMYQGTMASEAIKEPATAKSQLANNSAAISSAELLTMAKSGGNGGTPLDSVSVSQPVSNNTVMLVGRKKSIKIPFFNVTLDFTVVQPIQKSLLEANTATRSSSPNQVPPNLIGKKGPPSQNPKFQNDTLPSTLDCSQGPTVVTETSVNAKAPDAPAATYDSRVTFSIPAKAGQDAVLAFSNSPGIGATCANAGATCPQEESDLQFKKGQEVLGCYQGQKPTCITSYYDNPAGAPGQKLEVKYDSTTGTETKTYSTLFQPPHGLYYDPTSKYEKPPADFVATCKNRKYYECVFQAAAAKANDLANEYPCPP